MSAELEKRFHGLALRMIEVLQKNREAAKSLEVDASKLKSEQALIARLFLRRANEFVDSILAIKDLSFEVQESVGVIARALWEGSIVLQYFCSDTERRLYQLYVEDLKSRTELRSSPALIYDNEKLSLEEEKELAAALAEQTKYDNWRNEEKQKGRDPGDYDLNKRAILPKIKNMAKAVNAQEEYIFYQWESAATHWGLSSLGLQANHKPEGGYAIGPTPVWRLFQVYYLATYSYTKLVLSAGTLAGIPSYASDFEKIRKQLEDMWRSPS